MAAETAPGFPAARRQPEGEAGRKAVAANSPARPQGRGRPHEPSYSRAPSTSVRIGSAEGTTNTFRWSMARVMPV